LTDTDHRPFENSGGVADPAVIARILERRQQRRREQERVRKREARHTPEQRKRDRERQREARGSQTPEQLERERVRKQEARKRQTPEQRERERERSRKKLRPFMAIDGEGGGTDRLGRQNYLLMIAAGTTGELYKLHRDGKPFSVRDCLEFLLSLPAAAILVGYGLGYDATQILRGITNTPTLRRILNPPHGKNGPCYTYWGDYAIIYQQGQYFRVARINRSGPKPSTVKGSSRTVYETLGFFQCSFVTAINKWAIGNDRERAVISENKARRNEFSEMTDAMVEYCELECRYLAMLMTDFREVCITAGILPRQWSGAGWLAAALLDRHRIPKRPLTAKEISAAAEHTPGKKSKPAVLRRPQRNPEFDVAANFAYYGGRFEVSRIGLIPGPLYQYDLRSAYPAALPDLPCPLHTRWQHKPRARRLPESGLYLAKTSFSHPGGLWCGLPFRRNGGLFWPLQGTGWYWSTEIKAARRYLHAAVVVHDLWIARRCCDCRPFDWVRALYDERRRIGSDTRGYPLKLALNSLYGKLAQRSGRGPYHDAVAAGLITAITRARLIEAIRQDPEAVVMLATDAVFSTRPLSLDIGDDLGQWEENIWPDLFVAQPGVYWSPSELEKSLKSRGAPRSIIGAAAPRFQRAFSDWIEVLRRPGAIEDILRERLVPAVQVTVRIFHGCRLALARGKPWLAGKWEDVTRCESFEWRTKRDPMRVRLTDDGCLLTFPPLIPLLAESEGYKPADFDKVIDIIGESGGTEEIDENMLLEAMPDHIPFLPSE
jgi:hypothetical protein